MTARRLVIAAVLTAGVSSATAEPASDREMSAGLRLSGSLGALEEITWAAPGVEVFGALRSGRLVVELRGGYAPIDNHTYLSDARLVSLTGFAGVGLAGPRLRAGAVAGVEHIAFHADPDILAELPATDLLARRSAALFVSGLELAAERGFGSLGLFVQGSAQTVELTGDADGEQRRARLIRAGVFVEIRFVGR